MTHGIIPGLGRDRPGLCKRGIPLRVAFKKSPVTNQWLTNEVILLGKSLKGAICLFLVFFHRFDIGKHKRWSQWSHVIAPRHDFGFLSLRCWWEFNQPPKRSPGGPWLFSVGWTVNSKAWRRDVSVPSILLLDGLKLDMFGHIPIDYLETFEKDPSLCWTSTQYWDIRNWSVRLAWGIMETSQNLSIHIFTAYVSWCIILYDWLCLLIDLCTCPFTYLPIWLSAYPSIYPVSVRLSTNLLI